MFEIEICQRAFTKQGMPKAHLKKLCQNSYGYYYDFYAVIL